MFLLNARQAFFRFPASASLPPAASLAPQLASQLPPESSVALCADNLHAWSLRLGAPATADPRSLPARLLPFPPAQGLGAMTLADAAVLSDDPQVRRVASGAQGPFRALPKCDSSRVDLAVAQAVRPVTRETLDRLWGAVKRRVDVGSLLTARCQSLEAGASPVSRLALVGDPDSKRHFDELVDGLGVMPEDMKWVRIDARSGTHVPLSFDGIDPSVLAELPQDIVRMIKSDYRQAGAGRDTGDSQRAALPESLSQCDPAVLASLPPGLVSEIKQGFVAKPSLLPPPLLPPPPPTVEEAKSPAGARPQTSRHPVLGEVDLEFLSGLPREIVREMERDAQRQQQQQQQQLAGKQRSGPRQTKLDAFFFCAAGGSPAKKARADAEIEIIDLASSVDGEDAAEEDLDNRAAIAHACPREDSFEDVRESFLEGFEEVRRTWCPHERGRAFVDQLVRYLEELVRARRLVLCAHVARLACRVFGSASCANHPTLECWKYQFEAVAVKGLDRATEEELGGVLEWRP